MNFKDIKELAINLYNQGKSEEEIKKLCKVPITKEMIANWIQESKEIENGKRLSKLYRKMQKAKKIEITPQNKEDIIEDIKKIAFQILEIEENSQIAMNELVRCFTIKKEYELGRIYGSKLLQITPNNIFALYNMAKLEMNAGNYDKSTEYNSKILELQPYNKQALVQKELIEKNRNKSEEKGLEDKIKKLETYEQEVLREIQEGKVDLETKQNEYAKQKEETKYTKENKELYMQRLQKMFYEGKVNSQNIEQIKQELYRYPNQVESVIFISELYYLITEKEERAIEELDEFINSQNELTPIVEQSLQERILDFRARIQIKQKTEEIEKEQEERNKELKNEQRRYMMQIAQKLSEGKIKKEEVETIIENLEKCQDRDKAIFLIIKIYENLYGNNEALKAIEKYSRINNITETEREYIVKIKTKMESPIEEKQNYEKKVKNKLKKKNKKQKYKKQILRDKIRKRLQEKASVKEIYEELKDEEFVTLKSISKIKSNYLKEDEKAMQEYNETIGLAIEFLADEYTIEQTYGLFDYNIGKNVLNELKQKMNQKER